MLPAILLLFLAPSFLLPCLPYLHRQHPSRSERYKCRQECSPLFHLGIPSIWHPSFTERKFSSMMARLATYMVLLVKQLRCQTGGHCCSNPAPCSFWSSRFLCLFPWSSSHLLDPRGCKLNRGLRCSIQPESMIMHSEFATKEIKHEVLKSGCCLTHIKLFKFIGS